MPGKRKTYTPEFKFKVVLESFQRDTTLEEVCRKFNVPSSLGSRWRKEFQQNGPQVFTDKRNHKTRAQMQGDAPGESPDELKKRSRLEEKMAESNQGIDIQIKRITVVAVAVAGAIAIIEGPGNYDLWSTMTGIVLLMILQVFVLQTDSSTAKEPLPNPYELAVFNAVWALCFLIAIGFILDIISNVLTLLLNLGLNSVQTSTNPPPIGNTKQINDLINLAVNVLSNIIAFVIWLFIAWNREVITSNPRYLSLFGLFTKRKHKPATPSGSTKSHPAAIPTASSSADMASPTVPPTSESAQLKQNTSDK